ncbi:hypothetical protein [Streptomyces dioscori]|uniref:hypothetical protein n=1 Tax=Streptomyces dioscori TaxID=2109333 RepID=UPI001CECE3A0|nr:hypothetical protein [Streptomyces dioscori]
MTLAYVRACGGDVRERKRRWLAVEKALAEWSSGSDEAEAVTAPGPYPELAPYEENDAEQFLGRAEAAGHVCATVVVEGPSGLTAVFGVLNGTVRLGEDAAGLDKRRIVAGDAASMARPNLRADLCTTPSTYGSTWM